MYLEDKFIAKGIVFSSLVGLISIEFILVILIIAANIFFPRAFVFWLDVIGKTFSKGSYLF